MRAAVAAGWAAGGFEVSRRVGVSGLAVVKPVTDSGRKGMVVGRDFEGLK